MEPTRRQIHHTDGDSLEISSGSTLASLKDSDWSTPPSQVQLMDGDAQPEWEWIIRVCRSGRRLALSRRHSAHQR